MKLSDLFNKKTDHHHMKLHFSKLLQHTFVALLGSILFVFHCVPQRKMMYLQGTGKTEHHLTVC